jgi:hypothetical protein
MKRPASKVRVPAIKRNISLPRRTFLRGVIGGATVAIGLPALDLMFNENGTAHAGGGAPATRFGVWFWGNGVKPDRWVPSGTGTGWTPSEEMMPLAGVRDYVSPCTGFEIKTATHPHHSGMTGIMTGARYHQNGTTRDTIVSTFAYPSVDQVAADHLSMGLPFRSVEVGVTTFRGTDEGTTFQHLSHNGPNNPNPSEYSADALFRRVFGAGPSTPQIDAARASVLDAVVGQINALQPTLGTRDRARLDQHLTSVRALEMRLRAGAGVCAPPANPGDVVDDPSREPIEEKNRVMTELLAFALACDLTRSFSVQYSTAGSGVLVWQVGAMDGLHGTCHTEANPQPIVHAATVFTMGQLAFFLDHFRNTPDGPGTNLLDNCSILCTTELSDGWSHTNNEFPILICGRGGGRLHGGVHFRAGGNNNASIPVLTALRGAGVPNPTFGYEAGQVSETIGELLTGA